MKYVLVSTQSGVLTVFTLFLLIGCRITDDEQQENQQSLKILTIGNKKISTIQLEQLLNRKARELVEKLKLEEADSKEFVHEPVGYLRGKVYRYANNIELTVFIASNEPVWKDFNGCSVTGCTFRENCGFRLVT